MWSYTRPGTLSLLCLHKTHQQEVGINQMDEIQVRYGTFHLICWFHLIRQSVVSHAFMGILFWPC
jgi:hypothetical protein